MDDYEYQPSSSASISASESADEEDDVLVVEKESPEVTPKPRLPSYTHVEKLPLTYPLYRARVQEYCSEMYRATTDEVLAGWEWKPNREHWTSLSRG